MEIEADINTICRLLTKTHHGIASKNCNHVHPTFMVFILKYCGLLLMKEIDYLTLQKSREKLLSSFITSFKDKVVLS